MLEATLRENLAFRVLQFPQGRAHDLGGVVVTARFNQLADETLPMPGECAIINRTIGNRLRAVKDRDSWAWQSPYAREAMLQNTAGTGFFEPRRRKDAKQRRGNRFFSANTSYEALRLRAFAVRLFLIRWKIRCFSP